MRFVLVVALLLPSAALAGQAEADRYIQEQRDKIAALRAANEQRRADQAALCARVGGVRIGQTAESVRKSCWGKPARVNTTATAGGTHEQWVYGTGYVYLTNGLVTAVQTTR